MISIHAPLTGSDSGTGNTESRHRNFNPRSPHRERLGARCNLRRYLDFNPRSPHRERRVHFPDFAFWLQFQSTLPSQGATDEKFGEFLNNFISIHAPLTGSDSQREGVKVTVTVFQSTLPSQGATVVDAFMRMAFGDFNPRSPHRERLLAIVKYFRRRNFNPRSPHRERLG